MHQQDNGNGLSNQIEAIVAEVKKAILVVEKDVPIEGVRLSIKQVDLTLQAVVTREVGGGLKFTLFGHDFGPSIDRTTADTQTIELSFVPSPDEAMAFGAEQVSENLVATIRAIREGVAGAAASQPRFTMSESTVELNFQVDKDGKIEFIIVGEAKKTNAQAVKLTLLSA